MAQGYVTGNSNAAWHGTNSNGRKGLRTRNAWRNMAAGRFGFKRPVIKPSKRFGGIAVVFEGGAEPDQREPAGNGVVEKRRR